jgi:UDP-N-acetylglucosamine acyltransferase
MTDIHPTAVIAAGAGIADGVAIGPYCVVGPNVTVGSGTKLMSHVVLDGHTKIGSNCAIFPFASIGTQTQDLKFKGGKTYVEIGDRTTIREYVTVNSATDEGKTTKVGSDCHICAYAHIAHACKVGDGVIMSNCATLAGEVVVEDQAIIGGLSAAHQFVRIGRLCMVGGCSAVRQDCPPFMMVGLKRKNVSEAAQSELKRAYKILYRDGLSTSQALEKMRAELAMSPEVEHLISFIEGSERGITK